MANPPGQRPADMGKWPVVYETWWCGRVRDRAVMPETTPEIAPKLYFRASAP